jgi:biopolymer transport protein TolR
MGMTVGAAGRKSGRGRRGVPRYGAMADINMTPFIDVILVLLIIFMVAAPLLTNGIVIDLPKTKAGPLNVDQKPISVSIDAKGQAFLMDQPVADADLIDKLRGDWKAGPESRIYLGASRNVIFGRFVEILADLKAGDFEKVAIVTKPLDAEPDAK